MIYLVYWLICSICSFSLLKTYISSNLIRVGIQDASIAQAMRNAAKKDDSIEEMKGAPDNVLNAIFWTVVLVINLLIWPCVLVTLVHWKINKQDFSDFRSE